MSFGFVAIGMMAVSLQAEVPEAEQDIQLIDAVMMDQTQFMNKLSASNKTLFNQFTDAQKTQAMDMTKPMNNKPGLTPDQAVEKIARDNNMPMTKKSPSGSCPVK